MKKRLLSLALALVMVMVLVPAATAATSGGQKTAEVALKYCGQRATASTFGFSTDWCGAFLFRCAQEAGEAAAMCGSEYTMQYNPHSMNWFIDNGAEVGYFYDALPWNTEATVSRAKKMNKSDYTPQLGDVIYFDWNGYGNGGLYHVEIVTQVDGRGITTVGGNTQGDNWWDSSVNSRWSNVDNSPYIVAFARPKYSNGSTATPTPAPSTPPVGGKTKTQYRYHRYENTDGSDYFVCAYLGLNYYPSMKLVYSDWVDAPYPEVKKGYVNYLEHPHQSGCERAGCLSSDPFEVHRHVAPDGKVWYYEETRTVAAEEPTQPAPPPETTPNCSNGHTWGDWKTVKEAVCGIKGQRTRTCSVCGETETETLPALEHEYRVDGETDEAIYYVCANCGDNYTEEKKPPETGKGDFRNFTTQNRYTSGSFGDVKSGDWFYENVKATYELGLMKGTGSGTFSPGNNVTLAEAITLAARIHSIYYTGSDSFASYDGGNWYDPYVDYARENNIINTYYNYSRPATREEFVRILAKALPEEALENIAGRISFADSGDITYMAEVRLLSGAGVINGIKENGQLYFKPLNTITRAEVAAVVARMAKPSQRVGN